MNLNDLFDKSKKGQENMESNQVPSNFENTDSQIEETTQKDPRIEALESEVESERTAKLRYLADYQNLLKQSQEKIQEARLAGNSTLVGKLLELFEDFERGLDHIRTLDNIEQIKISFDQIFNKIKQVIESQDLEEIPCNIGDDYDPETMEAVSVTNDEDKVTLIAQKGFRFRSSGKIVRPVKVIL